MHIHIHRPVICDVCKAEMSQFPGAGDWFHCVICGAKRNLE